MEPFAIIFIVLAFVFTVLLHIAALGRDEARIEAEVAGKGGRSTRVARKTLDRFFGSRRYRRYEVEYVDAAGRRHRAMCKTSFWRGVTWDADQLLPDPPVPGEEHSWTGGFPVVLPGEKQAEAERA